MTSSGSGWLSPARLMQTSRNPMLNLSKWCWQVRVANRLVVGRVERTGFGLAADICTRRVGLGIAMTDRPVSFLPPLSRAVLFAALLASCSAVVTPHANAQLPSGTWQYQWGDEFGGSALDGTKWHNGYPEWGMSSAAPTAIRQDLATVDDGALTLTATRVSEGGAEPFAGGMISTYQKNYFNGGYIEARILLPDSPGSWPAFWGLYDGWPPEADIMEYPIDTAAGSGYSQDEYHTAFHYRNTSGGNSAGAGKVNPGGAGDLGGAYHNFGMEWREDDWVGFYFDGQLVSQFGDDASIAQMQQMYLILNYAVAGWPGTPNVTEWPIGHRDETKVDWVRVWKQEAGSSSNWSYTGTSEDVQWDAVSNWSNGSPNLGGVAASFDTVNAAEQRIDWSGRRTLSVMNFDGDTRYRFGFNDDRLVLGPGNNGSQKSTINIASTSTAEHEVLATLEFAGGLDINNNSTQPLLLTGDVIGGGGSVRVRGPGVVSFDGSNSYTADTYIGTGQDQGIARARGQNAFGVGGTVVIGEAGNATTARIELENNALVSNNIAFRGRTNSSPAIVNKSGNNTISGTLNVEFGGSTYLLRSEAGQLTLSGGVALTAGTDMGNRNITLDGAGDGVIRGDILNGPRTSLAITKTGTGIWTLTGNNSYSGTTTVAEGTLAFSGSTGQGATSVAAGATLAGSGTVFGNLSAQSGAVVRVGSAGLTSKVAGEVIDDFDGYNNGRNQNIGAHANGDVTGGVWDGVFDGTGAAQVVDNAGSGDNSLLVYGAPSSGGAGWRGGVTSLAGGYARDFSLLDGQTATYFFQVMNEGNAFADTMIGLTARTTTIDVNDAWQDYSVMPYVNGNPGSTNLNVYGDNGTGGLITPLTDGLWQNVWLVVDNATKTFDVYTSTGTDAGTLALADVEFGRMTDPVDLEAFGVMGREDGRVRVDNIYHLSGVDIANPLAPELPAGEILSVQGNLTLGGATLEVNLDANTHDTIEVLGTASLDGVLAISLEEGFHPAAGESFTLLSASAISGTLMLGGPDGSRFSLANSTTTQLVLTALGGLPGDFNSDGVVNMADYLVWRNNLGAPESVLPAGSSDDANSVVDAGDYATWKVHFGQMSNVGSVGRSFAGAVGVPEPSALWLLTLSAALFRLRRRV